MVAVNTMKVRSLFESRTGAGSRGRVQFRDDLFHLLGLADAQGNRYRDQAGNPKLKNPTVNADMFSIKELAEGIIGPNYVELLGGDGGGDRLAKITNMRAALVGQHGQQAALEATGFGVDPTAFLNINTFTAVVGGLVEVKILEEFNSPEFIADQLMPAMPTNLNGQKIIGTTNLGDRAKKRLPGEPHERVQFGERWILTPETRENALAIDVLKEAVFFDLTGQILDKASSIGKWIGYRKELECIDAFLGVTNTFNYSSFTSNTYQTTQTIPTNSGYLSWYVNDGANELVDWTSLQTAWLLFARMSDPHTGVRILNTPNTILVNPAKFATANLIVGADSTQRRTGQPAATQATAAVLNLANTSSSPFAGRFNVLWSQLVEQRCTAADGLNLSQANADKYWWMFQQGKPFWYMQNYPLTVQQAAPNNYEMLDAGIIASYFGDERGIPAVISPWHVVRSTN